MKLKTKMLTEFKNFAMRGNVVDMAVGIIVGAAFGKIVSSLVADVIMPPIGVLLGGVDFTNLAISLKAASDTAPAVLLSYGKFIQTILDFLIISFSVFLLVKGLNTLKRKKDEAEVETVVEIPVQEKLLTEIRDILKEK